MLPCSIEHESDRVLAIVVCEDLHCEWPPHPAPSLATLAVPEEPYTCIQARLTYHHTNDMVHKYPPKAIVVLRKSAATY